MSRIRLAAWLALGLGFTAIADARSIRHPRIAPRVDFRVEDPPVAPARARGAAAPDHLSGRSLVTIGEDALVIDPDSGALLRIDGTGAVIARRPIGADAAQVTVDSRTGRAFVSDRHGDRIVVVYLASGLHIEDRWTVPAEPYGLALTPDRETLLVTSIAGRALTALDARTGAERWSLALEAPPRGIAVSPDGAHALVTSLDSGAVARVRLADRHVDHLGLERPAPRTAMPGPTPDADAGRSFARAAFAATYLRGELAVVAHQSSTPRQAVGRHENRGRYGGGGVDRAPITHHLTFLRTGAVTGRARVEVGTHQPRALAYDAARDILYVAGYGSDDVLALRDAGTAGVALAWRARLGTCGPTGMDVADDGTLMVFCALERRIARVRGGAGQPSVAPGEALTTSRLDALARRGRALFRAAGNGRLSGGGLLACASCHPEGRADGLSWRIDGQTLQTPVLAGRLQDTHPYKWDGGDATLDVSLKNTVKRLGGHGIGDDESRALAAYLESLPPPRAATRADAATIARGRALFASAEVGCTSCHDGPRYTDNARYRFAGMHVDTPSLTGVGQSAPYFHDGSAATLRAALLDNGSVHGMGDTGELSDRQLDELIAYLETL